MAYGNFGIALGASILVLFIIQISLHLGLFGRVASFRLMNRKQIREKEPAISVVVPLFAEDSAYLDNSLITLLTQDYSEFEVVVVYVGNNDDFFGLGCQLFCKLTQNFVKISNFAQDYEVYFTT